MFPLQPTSTLLLALWLMAIPLKPSISITSINEHPVIHQSSKSETVEPSRKNQRRSTNSNTDGDSNDLAPPRSITDHLLSSPQSINQLHSSKLDNLTQPFVLQDAGLSQHTHSRGNNQYHFPQPQPLVPIDTINTQLVNQVPKATPTYLAPNVQRKEEFSNTQLNYQRRALNRRDQSWPGTDTIFATKTIFISQPGPSTTVYVSDGHIINPPQPTSCAMNCNNMQNAWSPPSGNPNIVVATVTAYASAKKFAWDGFRSNSYFTIFIFVNLIHLFMIFGFGFVNFGL